MPKRRDYLGRVYWFGRQKYTNLSDFYAKIVQLEALLDRLHQRVKLGKATSVEVESKLSRALGIVRSIMHQCRVQPERIEKLLKEAERDGC